MEESAIDQIMLKSETLKGWARNFQHKRYLSEKVADTDEGYFVGIRGMRGIGKTVLLLQTALQMENSAYFSADWTYAAPYTIYEVAEELRRRGVKNLFIDEIHTRHGWANDIKTIYDEHQMRVFFSGSSSMSIKKSGADLSRRVALYDLKPLSFREYLNIRRGFHIPPQSFGQIIKNARELAMGHAPAYEHLAEYMRRGGVFYEGEGFTEALENSVDKVITHDLAALRDINIKYEGDAKKLLYHIAVSKPFEAGFSSLSQKLGVSKTFVIRLVDDLASTGLVKVLYPCKGDNVAVRKEPKIYLSVPFRSFLAPSPDKGALREEFFVNHADVSCYFKTERGAKTSDFMANGLKIEVGGEQKSFGQKPDYVVSDGLVADERRIPLFLFGFLY
ncbi:MAG: ATP-binding protein [Candidatus Bilamarchaeaceae archaeon]